jgi:hypothetical protein
MNVNTSKTPGVIQALSEPLLAQPRQVRHNSFNTHTMSKQRSGCSTSETGACFDRFDDHDRFFLAPPPHARLLAEDRQDEGVVEDVVSTTAAWRVPTWLKALKAVKADKEVLLMVFILLVAAMAFDSIQAEYNASSKDWYMYMWSSARVCCTWLLVATVILLTAINKTA